MGLMTQPNGEIKTLSWRKHPLSFSGNLDEMI